MDIFLYSLDYRSLTISLEKITMLYGLGLWRKILRQIPIQIFPPTFYPHMITGNQHVHCSISAFHETLVKMILFERNLKYCSFCFCHRKVLMSLHHEQCWLIYRSPYFCAVLPFCAHQQIQQDVKPNPETSTILHIPGIVCFYVFLIWELEIVLFYRYQKLFFDQFLDVWEKLETCTKFCDVVWEDY